MEEELYDYIKEVCEWCMKRKMCRFFPYPLGTPIYICSDCIKADEELMKKVEENNGAARN